MKVRAALLAVAALLALAGTMACSEIAAPDQVGLYYLEGQSDGYKFDHCVDPGKTDDLIWNNSVVWLTNSTRTWNIAKDGGDTKAPITVAAKPEENQPSGVQVNVYTLTNFALNTSCDGGQNSPLVQWWEKVGRRYNADTPDGWLKMLNNTVVPALETASRNTIREYNADPLVAGIGYGEVQQKIGAAFAVELKRIVGGDFFCGPSFDRAKGTCPPVEVALKDVDYSDPGIQEARNAKVKALEQAAAQVAEAQGKVAAANAQKELYSNPAWVQLQIAQAQLEAAKVCSANPNCTLIIGGNGNVNVATK